MKTIISGSNGFVGKNIIKHLKKNKTELISVTRTPTTKDEINWDDLFSGAYNFNAIIHLAGKAHDTKSTIEIKDYFIVNTELTKKIFDFFLQSNATTFIYFSSVKAVADSVDGLLKEDVLPNPQTPYGQSKQQAEAYILDAFIPSGKRVFILRPCMIHGPGNKGNLNLLYKFVKKGIPYPLAAFDNRRSFLSINNLNFIIEKLINDSSISGGVYNVADDEPLSTNEVINLIAKTEGLKASLWKLNPKLIKTFASIGDKLRLPLNTERLKKLTESYVVSNEKIKSALHIDSLPTSSIDGLKTTIESFSTR